MQVIRTTGGRKTAIARIGLKTGKGNIEINKKPLEDYFQTEILRTVVKQPLQVDHETPYDITVNVTGGGFNGQAEAIRLAIARALCKLDGGYRAELKKQGMLTRDPRMVERKKYGRKKARKRFQFSKR